jgi:hypothetical protein
MGRTRDVRTTHILNFVVRMTVAEVVSLRFNPWVGHFGTRESSWRMSQRNWQHGKQFGDASANKPLVARV